MDFNGNGPGNPFQGFGNMGNMNEQLRRSFGPQFLQNIMRNLPLNELQNLQKNPEWGQLFGGQLFGGMNAPSQDYPRIDLYQTRNEVVAVVEAPGLESQNDIRINIKSDALTVSGNLEGRYANIPEERFSQNERFRGSFDRTVTLPVKVRPQQARATYRNGLLEVRMAKDTRQNAGGKTISVPINFS